MLQVYPQNRVVEILGISCPLIQAPMSWVTNAEMVSAVSNAGGLGVLGPNAGKRASGEGSTRTIRDEIRRTKELTDRPFGLNVILPSQPTTESAAYAKARLDMAFEEGVTVFVSVGEPDEAIFRYIKERQGLLVHRPLTPTIENMKRTEDFGADIAVATGYEEGGHIPRSKWGTFTIVPVMADLLTIPVMAAGGINDRRGVKAAFALGAEGVFVGTRFVVTQEWPASAIAKERIIAATYAYLLTVSKVHRSVATSCESELERR